MIAKPFAKWVDLHWTGGALKDTWGALRWQEDWETAVPIPAGLDGSWRDQAEIPIRVAHALGASGQPGANTLAALDLAAQDGFHLFEVDLWLDPAGELRCQHNDETALPLATGDCTLARLLPRVASLGGWVVLDIKSDFEQTGNAVLQLLRSNGLASRVVFQLYRAHELRLFSKWARQAALAEPLVTSYASHRSVQHIADHARALNVRVMTLPLSDMPMLTRRPEGLTILVHPVHDCEDWARARKDRTAGIYTLTGLRCGAWAKPDSQP
ncbi:MAG: hypothetical protein ABI781_00620 [Burkholderiales bacterium]